MTARYYWSDLHLGHQKVAEIRGFKTVEGHDEFLMDSWQSTVSPQDHVWILGDISSGGSDGESKALELIKSLNGTKHLIAGNHDSVSSIHRDSWKHQEKFRDVFASVENFARHRIAKTEVLLSHFPYEGDHSGKEERYSQYRLKDLGSFLIHGHVHDEWLACESAKGSVMLNVGVDKWSTPVHLDKISRFMRATGIAK